MGRRKKEPEGTHRENIALAAEQLFMQAGIKSTTMDDIAKKAGYSKATLYVYFSDKDEISNYLVLKSMKQLYRCISDAAVSPSAIKDRYLKICGALSLYQENYPLYFHLALGTIDIDKEPAGHLTVLKETYKIGEQINQVLLAFLNEGIQNGDFNREASNLQTVFLLWSSLSGLIQMASNKQLYIEQSMKLTRQEFLASGFEKLYELIAFRP